ncbi:MAG: hypothetical protein M3209_03460 [Acidobacteriota bacterium]|nr:hypothetical protein [Acidobacteriota bacterium]
MNETDLIREIAATYHKYGWTLRRVLLKKDLLEKLGNTFDAGAPLAVSDVNALLFSRASGKNSEAWELRHISQAPFALFEIIGADTSEDERNLRLSQMEKRLKKRAEK